MLTIIYEVNLYIPHFVCLCVFFRVRATYWAERKDPDKDDAGRGRTRVEAKCLQSPPGFSDDQKLKKNCYVKTPVKVVVTGMKILTLLEEVYSTENHGLGVTLVFTVHKKKKRKRKRDSRNVCAVSFVKRLTSSLA